MPTSTERTKRLKAEAMARLHIPKEDPGRPSEMRPGSYRAWKRWWRWAGTHLSKHEFRALSTAATEPAVEEEQVALPDPLGPLRGELTVYLQTHGHAAAVHAFAALPSLAPLLEELFTEFACATCRCVQKDMLACPNCALVFCCETCRGATGCHACGAAFCCRCTGSQLAKDGERVDEGWIYNSVVPTLACASCRAAPAVEED